MTDSEAAFWAADNDQKMVMIAKDVLKQIKAGKLRPLRGIYLPSDIGAEGRRKPLDTALQSLARPCPCCGLGACFYSMVMLGDHITVGDIMIRDKDESSFSLDYNKFKQQLVAIMGADQFALIESAFEQTNMAASIAEGISTLAHAVKFGRVYHRHDDRLVAIMENIIRNKGTFKP